MLLYIEESVFSAGTRIFLFLCYGGNKMEEVLAKKIWQMAKTDSSVG